MRLVIEKVASHQSPVTSRQSTAINRKAKKAQRISLRLCVSAVCN